MTRGAAQCRPGAGAEPEPEPYRGAVRSGPARLGGAAPAALRGAARAQPGGSRRPAPARTGRALSSARSHTEVGEAPRLPHPRLVHHGLADRAWCGTCCLNAGPWPVRACSPRVGGNPEVGLRSMGYRATRGC